MLSCSEEGCAAVYHADCANALLASQDRCGECRRSVRPGFSDAVDHMRREIAQLRARVTGAPPSRACSAPALEERLSCLGREQQRLQHGAQEQALQFQQLRHAHAAQIRELREERGAQVQELRQEQIHLLALLEEARGALAAQGPALAQLQQTVLQLQCSLQHAAAWHEAARQASHSQTTLLSERGGPACAALCGPARSRSRSPRRRGSLRP